MSVISSIWKPECEQSILSQNNYSIVANLTIKGISHAITFDSAIKPKEDLIVFSAHFDIDRTLWDIKYGSEAFFAKLGMHVISDIVSFDVMLCFK